MLFDSHAHISDRRFDKDRPSLYRKIRDAGLVVVMDVGSDLATSLDAVRTAEQNDFCYAVVGCHPHEAKDFDDEQLLLIKGLAKKPKVKAIGEIGLDYHHNFSDRESQRYWFVRQVQMAIEIGMPIVIHDREAHADVMDILRENGAFGTERKAQFPLRPDGTEDARVLLHCYSGSAEMAEQYVKLGASISIAGPVTYPNARRSREVVEAVDLLHLLAETDAPYLTPVPFRGKTNIPPYVEHTVRKMAEIKGLPYEEVARQTCQNGCRFFDIEL
ncbi:MAG: TatD family hydrolase [Anaerovoracaceae bacterium]|jgi:TatD DNase family protein